MNTPKIARVEWEDAITIAGKEWADQKDICHAKPCKVVSVGFVMAHVPGSHITLAGSLTADGDGGGDICIPLRWTEKITFFDEAPVG